MSIPILIWTLALPTTIALINEGQDLTDLYKRFIVPVVGWWWFYAMAFCLMLFNAEAMTGRQALRLDDSAISECTTILSQLGFWQIPAERFNFTPL